MLLQNITSLASQKKAKFKTDNHTKMGEHLKMAIIQRVKNTHRSEILQRALAKGHMKDESDLKEKYASKPEQLAAIFKNGITFDCPIRECKLWADPDFVTEWQFTQSDETEETTTFEASSSESAKKKQKTETAPPQEGEERQLKTEDVVKLKELFDQAIELVHKYETAVAEANVTEIREYLPKKYLLKIAEKKSDLLSRIADINLTCQSGKSKFQFKALKMMCADIKKEAKDETTDVKGRTCTAWPDMAD